MFQLKHTTQIIKIYNTYNKGKQMLNFKEEDIVEAIKTVSETDRATIEMNLEFLDVDMEASGRLMTKAHYNLILAYQLIAKNQIALLDLKAKDNLH